MNGKDNMDKIMGDESGAVNLEKNVYDRNSFNSSVDVSFTQLITPETPQEELNNQPTTTEFFEMYKNLFYNIPKYGQTDSHLYLINESSEYINYEKNTEEFEALQNEISQLREQLLEEQRKNSELQLSNNNQNISPSQNSNNSLLQNNSTNNY